MPYATARSRHAGAGIEPRAPTTIRGNAARYGQLTSSAPTRPRVATDFPSSERSPFEHRIEGLDGHHAAAPHLGFMLTGAQWRDSWLHDFRSLYLVMEVILLGLAGGLLVSILTLEVSRPWVPALLLIVDATGSLLPLTRPSLTL